MCGDFNAFDKYYLLEKRRSVVFGNSGRGFGVARGEVKRKAIVDGKV